ncbi:hypothetical protein KFL_004150010 [Klebsormidium nitens]|uniref:Bro-N domain-containing protein n=1 Tax=Klebsormidium nitens TaxID=105231 RepID=A0A1Y1IHZ9_KLENI|nr:hypothetical protein KFL_004150010 [Klebsormidium nitens]|eukprot:GAQ88277.1 hypothetical protein KFL_004150010 [Klebsormidium nitens]
MDIAEAFETGYDVFQVNIQGTLEEPLFYAHQMSDIVRLTDVDAIVANLPSKCVVSRHGLTEREELLTENGVQLLLMKSQHPIADVLREWVFDTLKDIRLKAIAKIRQNEQAREKELRTLREDNNNLKEQTSRLEKETDRKTNFLYNFKLENAQSDSKCRIKLGKTKDTAGRQGPYRQTNPFGRLTYSVEVPADCINDAESVLHRLMKNTGGLVKSEVYDTSVEYAKTLTRVVADLFALTNGGSDCTDANAKIFQKVVGLLNHEIRGDVAQTSHQQSDSSKVTNQTLQAELTEIKDILTKMKEKAVTTPVLKDTEPPEANDTTLPDIQVVYDFNRFVDECCEVGTDFYDFPAEIHVRFILWARLTNRGLKEALIRYLKTRFMPCRIQDGEMVPHGYKGLRIIPYKRAKTMVLWEIEKFVQVTCVETCSSRLYDSDLEATYFRWKKEKDPDYEEDRTELKGIHTFLDQHYVHCALWKADSKYTEKGYYGICLKGNEATYKRRVPPSAARPVEELEEKSGLVKRKWDKVSDAAASLGWSTAKVGYTIKKKTIINGLAYKSREDVSMVLV